MAVECWKNLGPWSKTALVLGGGVVVPGLFYLYYQYRKQRHYADINEEDSDGVAKIHWSLEKKILMLGLDGSGKSSLLAALSKQDSSTPPKPTEGFNVMCVQTGKVSLNIWEIGGKAHMRQYWSSFLQDTCVLVFVVDSASADRLSEAKDELDKLLAIKSLSKLPIVIITNKQDVPGAKIPQDILKELDITAVEKSQLHLLATQVPFKGEHEGVQEVEKLLITLSSS